MKWFADSLKWLGTNEYMLGFISLLSIIGFLITIVVERRTATIDKILKHNELAATYNRERMAFAKSFTGHHDSIIKDGDHSTELVDSILKTITELTTKYSTLLPIRTRFRIWLIERQLMKKDEVIDFHKLSKRLVLLSAYLGKKEEKIHG